MIDIRVQQQDFDLGVEYSNIADDTAVGAVVSFVGKVRDMNLGQGVTSLHLEHYPGMTEKALHAIAEEAIERWELQRVLIIHRVGLMQTGEQIVLVITSSAHRGQCYDANEFIMDVLKSKAPFWKKECTDSGEHWIEQRQSDRDALHKWE
jgi:molybdopterin synthase catalytic subunit